MAWNNINYSALPWYDNISRQQHRKTAAQDQVWPLHTAPYCLPPFQVVKTTALTVVPTVFNLVSIANGSVNDCLSAMVAQGLRVESFTGYDIINYPGLALEDVPFFTEGQWYAVMSDGTNTWYSEIFYMSSTDLTQFVKVEFWHDQPFLIPDAHISYSDPFKNFLYIPTEICKPRYPYDEDLNDRDGYPFPLYSTQKKRFRFGYMLPEYLVDLVIRIQQHHFVVITHAGIQYNVTYIRITPNEEWASPGHLTYVEFEFETNTVTQVAGLIKPESEGHSYNQKGYDDSYL